MSTAQNKAIVRRLIDEMVNERDLAAADELIATDFVLRRPDGSELGRGPAGWKEFLRSQQSAFPDRHCTIDDILAEGDKVAVRWTQTATHRGDYLGIPATGKECTTTGISIYQIAEGNIEEIWVNQDTLGLMQQLGVIPKIS